MLGNKVKLLCSFGGNIFCHPSNGRVLYTGGNTRMVLTDRNVNYATLLLKMSEICKSSPSCIKVKFQFPGTTLESPLISVECDDDVSNMMDEADSSNKIFIFLFIEEGDAPISTTRDDTTLTHAQASTDSMSGPSTLQHPTAQELPNVQSSGTTLPGWEATLVASETVDNCESGLSTPVVRRDEIFTVGQAFPDAKSFSHALKEYALANNVALRFVAVTPERITAKCRSDDCSWRIHGSQLRRDLNVFKVKTLRAKHSCSRHTLNAHPQANAEWTASCIEARVRENVDYKPMDIVKDIEREHGIKINYMTAFRAKRKAMEQIYGSDESMMELIKTRRLPGRPKKAHIEKPREVFPLHCGRCNQIGHNRKTCKIPL
ncbi:uncharacterized protein LOC131233275 [Magnolia sinica]|uniref:uncharacterized protein LOC131233275 n=1 Tax=Magnolia sinica TaxID=86752 RepID=UPI002657C6B6|nr:uncharacterized protein LOC131233275 [Magnolia sinica]